LNDPTEGYFEAHKYDAGISELKNGKSKIRICSLSKRYNNGLMWSYYADANKGCCIEVEPDYNSMSSELQWERYRVSYSSKIPFLSRDLTPLKALQRKGKYWRHEEEIRFMAENNSAGSAYLPVIIHRVILGCRMTSSEKEEIKGIIQRINESLHVQEIDCSELDYGFNS
jgi:hypothetical protein